MRPMRGEHLLDSGVVAHIGDARHDLELWKRLAQLAFDEEKIVLRLLHEHELPRPEARNLPTNFGPNAPTSAGHQNDPATEKLADRIDIEVDRLPPQQILDCNVSNLAERSRAVDDLEQSRDDFYGK